MYNLKHVGNGEFIAELENGEVKKAGPSLVGMIRYTYFEDFTLPPIGWSVTNIKLMEDYHPKVHLDILSGKIKADGDGVDYIKKLNNK